ncbi:MAG: peptidoglycan DD-metalloendopeptidase family protein [Candidatus Velthaea sp.]|jgi:murein DD-endopeptidase MepM/ murein hydrolase activator NlpD
MRRLIAAAGIVPLLLGALPREPADARSQVESKIIQQQHKIHDSHVRLIEERGHLHGVQHKIGSIQQQLAETNGNIAAVNARLAELHARTESTERKLTWTRIQLDAARKTVQRHDEALRRRVVDAYEHADLGYIDVLLEARSFADFVERWNDVRFVIRANEATIRERRADEARVAGIESSLVGVEADLHAQQNQADEQHQALTALANERANLLAAAQHEQSVAQAEVVEYEEMSAEEEASLESLIQQKQAEEEARREAERRARQLAGEAVAPVSGAPGAVMWPVSGPITSPFGMRNHPVFGRFIMHAGIDIAAAEGTTIAAAATGRVILAQYAGNCGNMITIDHGGGMATNYCHLSQIFVGVGQDVQRGQAIGAVGMTGDATGPHLHFEVRIDGRPVDPLGYLH